MTDSPRLRFEGVTKRFGPVTALDEVSFECAAGRIHALLGENGAGKSTLIGILGGAHAPSEGTMAIDGHAVDFDQYSPQAAQSAGVAVVHQELALVGAMTVAENVFLGRELRRAGRLDRRGMRDQARDALARLGSDIDPDTPVERLSVAQSQLVEIARALVFDTKIIALDEPSAVLAGGELEALFAVVRTLRDHGVCVLYVSHRLDEVFALCDDYTVLKDGRLAGSGEVADVTTDDIIRMMVGREISAIFPPKHSDHGEPALEVKDLSVAGKVRDVGFTAYRREILGIAGLVGSGRSTMAQAIFGSIPVASGTVTVNGRQGPFRSPKQALRAGLAYLPEDRKQDGLALEKSVRWNMTLLLAPRLRTLARLIDAGRERELTSERVESLAIRTRADGSDLARQLSGGNQQKVVVAKWLLAEPRVLILDEPTRGIDVGSKQQIYELLRELADEGLSVVVISSELIEIIGLCDRILVLSDGHIAGELSGSEATEEAIMRLATPKSGARRSPGEAA